MYIDRTGIFHSSRSMGRMLAAIPMVGMLFSFNLTASAQEASGLKLPEDIASRAQASQQDSVNQKFQIEERRIGGRLERVTVYRSNGIDEVYENREPDSMWLSEENELGDVPNVRRWTIGSW